MVDAAPLAARGAGGFRGRRGEDRRAPEHCGSRFAPPEQNGEGAGASAFCRTAPSNVQLRWQAGCSPTGPRQLGPSIPSYQRRNQQWESLEVHLGSRPRQQPQHERRQDEHSKAPQCLQDHSENEDRVAHKLNGRDEEVVLRLPDQVDETQSDEHYRSQKRKRDLEADLLRANLQLVGQAARSSQLLVEHGGNMAMRQLPPQPDGLLEGKGCHRSVVESVRQVTSARFASASGGSNSRFAPKDSDPSVQGHLQQHVVAAPVAAPVAQPGQHRATSATAKPEAFKHHTAADSIPPRDRIPIPGRLQQRALVNAYGLHDGPHLSVEGGQAEPNSLDLSSPSHSSSGVHFQPHLPASCTSQGPLRQTGESPMPTRVERAKSSTTAWYTSPLPVRRAPNRPTEHNELLHQFTKPALEGGRPAAHTADGSQRIPPPSTPRADLPVGQGQSPRAAISETILDSQTTPAPGHRNASAFYLSESGANLKRARAEPSSTQVFQPIDEHTQVEILRLTGTAKRDGGYDCILCSKGFHYKQHLQTHVKTVHLKIKSHSCNLCSKTFGEKSALTKHKRTVHHKLRPFACQKCGASFGQRAHLRKHQQSKFGCMGRVSPSSSTTSTHGPDLANADEAGGRPC